MTSARLLLILLAVVVVLAAAIIPLILALLRRRTGFAFTADGDSQVIASDVGTQPSILLRDPQLGICGKQDYLLDTVVVGGRRLIVPMEVKPTRQSQRLYAPIVFR